MERLTWLLLILLTSLSASAAKIKYPGRKTYVYRYTLIDKAHSDFSLTQPRRFLSHKSLLRRERQGLAVDSTDLPVSRAYIELFKQHGVEVIGTSRWQNTVLVRSTDTLLLAGLTRMPIVVEGRCVFASPDSIDAPGAIRWNVHENFNLWDSVKNDRYAGSREQIESLGGIRLHQAGFTGKGITIAVLDGGFQNYDRIPALQYARIKGIRDFVAPIIPDTEGGKKKTKKQANAAPFHANDHGTKVLSALAANAPEVMMGTAPDATYWLLKCEDPDTEQPIEEDYWTMAAEMADSVGADIINSSLGYFDFDGDDNDLRFQDLDGKTTFISRSASMLARKGIILCNSAGNAGMGQWKKISVPADAHDILTVGAVDKRQRLAAFSSIGPTQDGRVKPDVVAQGTSVTLLSGRGTLVRDMGTSFSTPLVTGLVACLWQAMPEKSALEIIELVRRSASHYNEPTNIYGYGMPDFWNAYIK